MIIKACMLTFITTILYGILRPVYPQSAFACKLFCVFTVVLSSLTIAGKFMQELNTMLASVSFGTLMVKVLAQMFGIGFLCDLFTGIAREEGLNSVASQLELYGKLSLIAMTWPFLTTLIDSLKQLL